ncbi:MAG: 2-oxo acid dehydrogenase subunit E2 [Bdellovibrionaceae bacterium]|nr:2-oxo acid dehydrogenase subunit E2 [Pseudobdellovibrionaceae bacterium]
MPITITIMPRNFSIWPRLSNINAWSMNDIMVASHMVTMTSLASIKKIEEVRQSYKENGMQPPSYTAIIIKATYLLIKRYPEVNRAILGPPFFRKIIQFENFDINVAVEKSLPNIPGQAYAPVIRNVDKKDLLEITKELQFFATSTEENDNNLKLFMRVLKFVPYPFAKWILNAPYWFPHFWIKHKGCACWVNSPAKSGADLLFTLWPWPITFSFGVVKKRPWVFEDQVMAEMTIPLTMVFDRRLLGGGPAGRLFSEFKKIIEDADSELF